MISLFLSSFIFELPISLFLSSLSFQSRISLSFSEISSNEEKHGRPKETVKQTESNGARGSSPPPTMPTAVEQKILERRRFDVKMVMEKKLPKIDLSSNYARLNIPKRRMRVGFPTKEEQENLEKRKKDGKHCEDLIVSLTEPNFKVSIILLRMRLTRNTTSHILCRICTSLQANMKGPYGSEQPMEEKVKLRQMVAPEARYIIAHEAPSATTCEILTSSESKRTYTNCIEDKEPMVGFVHCRFVLEEVISSEFPSSAA